MYLPQWFINGQLNHYFKEKFFTSHFSPLLYLQPCDTGDVVRNEAIIARCVEYIKEHISPDAEFRSFDTICRQVANRMPNVSTFAKRHDLVLFVCGRKSSNGKVLFNECQRVNPNSHLIEGAEEIDPEWLKGINSVGICGATSTPKWLMEQCRDAILTANTEREKE